jgi:hypothetical protein
MDWGSLPVIDKKQQIESYKSRIIEFADSTPSVEETEAGARVRDWQEFLSELEYDLRVNLPEQMDDPVIRWIQRTVREYLRD